MKVVNFETTIKEILEFKHIDESPFYGDFSELEIFNPIASLDTYGMTLKTTDNLIQKNYVLDQCNDGCSRQVYILFYNEIPFAIYQYIGKGYYSNDAIFDKDTYHSFIKDYMADYLSQLEIKVANQDSKYTAQNYNMAYFKIENNTLVAKSDYR